MISASPIRRISAIAAAFLVAIAAGCASCEDTYCGVDPDRPEFGAGTRKFLNGVGNLPEWTASEFDERGDRLATFSRSWWGERKQETSRTGAMLADLGPAVGREFSGHGGELVDFFARSGERVGKDSCCFF